MFIPEYVRLKVYIGFDITRWQTLKKMNKLTIILIMGLFSSLFGIKTEAVGQTNQDKEPNNAKLINLMNKSSQNASGKNYKNVINELMNGESYLILTSQNNGGESEQWTETENETQLKLTCIFNLDGLKVLGAFTDEQSLLEWSKKPKTYTAMSSKDVMKLCKDNGIDRIVINSNQPNMFVLERSQENVDKITIKEDTKLKLGSPNKPLNKKILSLLKENFKTVKSITEVYQYGQTKGNEFSIVLGIKLSSNTDNAKTAAVNSVQNALQDQALDQNLDVFFIETEEWYESIKAIEDGLIYKK